MQVIYLNIFYMQITQIYVAHLTLPICSLLTLIILMLNYKILVNGWKLINRDANLKYMTHL